MTGTTWDIIGGLRYVAHHDDPFGRWWTADATSLWTGILVATGNEDRISLDPRQVLRLAVLQ